MGWLWEIGPLCLFVSSWHEIICCIAVQPAAGVSRLPVWLMMTTASLLPAAGHQQQRLLAVSCPWSVHLFRTRADYEPGIHYPQAQMQAGTTGINTFRLGKLRAGLHAAHALASIAGGSCSTRGAPCKRCLPYFSFKVSVWLPALVRLGCLASGVLIMMAAHTPLRPSRQGVFPLQAGGGPRP